MNKRAQNRIKAELKKNNSTIIVRDLNTTLSIINRITSR